MVQKLILKILHLALCCESVHDKDLLNIDDCNKLFVEAQKQAIDGVLLDGYAKLRVDRNCSADYKRIKLQWIANTVQIEQRNELVNTYCQQLFAFFKAGGYKSCILKGQGMSLLYPNPKRRRCGDIDLWVDGERDNIINFVRSKGVKIYDVHLVHATAEFFKDVPVEIHFRPSWMYNPFLDRKLQSFFASQASAQFAHYDNKVGFAYPTIFFNLVHSMVHINRHIFEEGVGLRQLMDYYFILKHSSHEERMEAYKVLCDVGLKKFTGAVMYVMQQVFLLEDDTILCAPNTKLGSQLLDNIMEGGNFGKAFGLKHGRNKLEKGLLQLKNNLKLLLPYANEALWIPFFQVWHYGWRKRHGYL